MGISSLLHDLSTKDPQPAAPAVTGDELSEAELRLNRYQNGVNIGALFVQEKWIDSSLFKDGTDTGGSELGALKSWGKTSLKEVREKFEHHWDTFVTDDDLDKMRERGITTARIPIGFYSLGEKSLLKHTEFEPFAEVYQNSWDYVSKLVKRLASRQIDSVIDLHAVPGGANGDEHSGTSSGKAELWEHSRNRAAAIDTYKHVCGLIEKLPSVVSLQLVNEVPYGESKCPGFFLDAESKIRKENASLPLVISDGWDCGSLCDKVKKWDSQVNRNQSGSTAGFIIDTHVYRTFSEEDRSKPASQHINDADHFVGPDDDIDIIVGEWSCTLDGRSWDQDNGADRDAMEVDFGKRQLQNYRQLAGNFFWTLKFGQGVGGSWDWLNMSSKGMVLSRIEPGKGDRDSSLKGALDQHTNYWRSQNSDTDWEDFRFEDGFCQGWDDAEQFAKFDGSRPGRIAALKAARLAQHVKKRGSSDKIWVFGQAYVQGVRARTG